MFRLLSLALVAAAEVSVDHALLDDDQCAGDDTCGLNALQMKGQMTMNQDSEAGWLKDISSAEKTHFKRILAPLQKPIVANYKNLEQLELFVNYTMEKVENATGSFVVWNRKSLLQEKTDELATTGSRRRSTLSESEELPPRAKYVNKILIYLNKDMDAVWNYNTIVDRKRWGVGNTITSSPYGPHGEHPERWKANGTFPLPEKRPDGPVLSPANSLKMSLKANTHKYENKYATQLQQDYQSLIDNINDVAEKSDMLRARLFKMDVYAEKFQDLPSGVWNKIDAQS
ncbi:unnamed protein product [Effrenium voratum]|nr:unnamed protein product [Effrenium voratum]